jgi:hypothetical protein
MSCVKQKNELHRLQVAGFYRDVDLGEPYSDIDEAEKKIAEKLGFNPTEDDRYKILEMHVNLDLEMVIVKMALHYLM